MMPFSSLSPAFYSFFHLSKIREHQLTCQTPPSSLIRRCAFRNCALAFPEPLPYFQVMSSTTQRSWDSLLNSQLLSQFVENYGVCALARLGFLALVRLWHLGGVLDRLEWGAWCFRELEDKGQGEVGQGESFLIQDFYGS